MDDFMVITYFKQIGIFLKILITLVKIKMKLMVKKKKN